MFHEAEGFQNNIPIARSFVFIQ